MDCAFLTPQPREQLGQYLIGKKGILWKNKLNIAVYSMHFL